MQDETDLQDETKRLAALEADLKKWKEIESDLSEKFEKEVLQQPGEVATMLDKEYRRRRDFYNASEIERRNGLSLDPPGLREPRVTTQHDYADVLQRAKDRAHREAAQLAEQAKAEYLADKKAKFLADEEHKRKLAAADQTIENPLLQHGVNVQIDPTPKRMLHNQPLPDISSLNQPVDKQVVEEPQKRKEAEPDPVPDIKVDHKLMEDMYPHVDAMAELLRSKHPEMLNDWDYER